ncbi:S1/P1 Nuclease [Marivirga sp. S37H4]|uniref:S1/P1 Nuclease n=1 Tax=Marivirga aurantiaca TaxID=2802615 RepID=A0A934X1U5_9BACT|nr:zinc dependent phospholipase C family protein [Marivirga aurantiaca]MBK6266902.1 S1/P1 Nuclease [Marivirga aurantiaca]
MKRTALTIAIVMLSGFTQISFQNEKKALWGFYGHQQINRIAVFTLPPEMITFYKMHIQYITENAVNPDRRRYAVKGEAPRHYIDLDVYGDSAVYKLPRFWFDAVEEYTEDTLKAYGIVPWHVQFVTYQLTEAFKKQDVENILRISADLGHYIADANVPLHTTENYNGQLSGQYGIHGFWESRLPELYADDYDFFVGKANYIENTQIEIWEAVEQAHLCLDSVFQIEKNLTKQFKADEKYSSELRGNVNMRVYSRDFSKAYHLALAGQVERQMRNSIKMVGDFWYTAWVNAGQPNLNALLDNYVPIEKIEEYVEPDKDNPLRNHESGIE